METTKFPVNKFGDILPHFDAKRILAGGADDRIVRVFMNHRIRRDACLLNQVLAVFSGEMRAIFADSIDRYYSGFDHALRFLFRILPVESVVYSLGYFTQEARLPLQPTRLPSNILGEILQKLDLVSLELEGSAAQR